jgi:hypothetical protein
MIAISTEIDYCYGMENTSSGCSTKKRGSSACSQSECQAGAILYRERTVAEAKNTWARMRNHPVFVLSVL